MKVGQGGMPKSGVPLFVQLKALMKTCLSSTEYAVLFLAWNACRQTGARHSGVALD